MNKNDRRVLKTKKVLRDTLIRLLQTKELHSITVKELVTEADIHRATFYLHYQDVFDLYGQMEEELFADLVRLMSADANHSYDGTYRAIVEFVYENKAIVELAFGKSSNMQFRNRISELLIQKYLDIWMKEDGPENLSDQMRYITAYHIQGCMGIISQWVADGFSVPQENIVELLRKFDWNIAKL